MRILPVPGVSGGSAVQTAARPFLTSWGVLDFLYPHLADQSQGRPSLPPHCRNLQAVAPSGVDSGRWQAAVGHVWSCGDQEEAQRPVASPGATLEARLQRFGVVPLTLYPDPVLDRLRVFPESSTPPLQSSFNWMRQR